jgi:hypothetical protein
MFKLEKIFGLLAIVAIVLKWNMLPGGNIMLLLSLSLLSLLFTVLDLLCLIGLDLNN